jgi:hypothetical protein
MGGPKLDAGHGARWQERVSQQPVKPFNGLPQFFSQVSKIPHPPEGNYKFAKATSIRLVEKRSNSRYRIRIWDAFKI